MKIDYYPTFYSDQYYHVYNRGNNGEKIFYSTDNYLFFLKRYSQYLSDSVDTLAYCFLQNHFHLLIRVKNKNLISYNFRIFLLSYSKAINNQTGRTGSLFQKRYKRTIIEDKSSICRAMLYIHSNPLHHKIVRNFMNYPYSSYKSILSEKETKLCRAEVLNLFNGRDNFIKLHQEKMEQFDSERFFIENE
jgi:REP element-mobilizing transposase RayT